MVECLPCVCEVLGSVPSTMKEGWREGGIFPIKLVSWLPFLYAASVLFSWVPFTTTSPATVLRIKLGILPMLGKHSTTEIQLKPLGLYLLINSVNVPEITLWAWYCF